MGGEPKGSAPVLWKDTLLVTLHAVAEIVVTLIPFHLRYSLIPPMLL